MQVKVEYTKHHSIIVEVDDIEDAVDAAFDLEDDIWKDLVETSDISTRIME